MQTHDGLFGNERESNLDSATTIIEEALGELGYAASRCRVERGDARRAWRIGRDGASVDISLVEHPDFCRLRLEAMVLDVAAAGDRLRLYERALTLNDREITGAAFALRGDGLLLVQERSTVDLDYSEVLDGVRQLERFASRYRDELPG